MGRLLAFAAAALAAAWLAAPALADDSFAACPTGIGAECATVVVPLDRSGGEPGTVSLHVERLRAKGTPRGVMVLLAGGPGQPSAELYRLTDPVMARMLRERYPGYTLVAFDPRGSGRSGRLTCPTFAVAGVTYSPAHVARCAAELGTRRHFYTTRDNVEDVESVREALGVDRIAVAGVSYGTDVAAQYALLHPDHVERVLLDSPTTLDWPQPYASAPLRAIPRVLDSLCAPRACAPGLGSRFVALANKLEQSPLGWLNGLALLSYVQAGDLDSGVAAELPAAIAAASAGDIRPFARLRQLLRGSTAVDLEQTLNLATTCDDMQAPWQSQDPYIDRVGALSGAIESLPDAAFAPFGRWAAYAGGAAGCVGWPEDVAPATPIDSLAAPAVPVLVLSGTHDVRTPVGSAAAMAARFPQGHLLVVPGVGHAVQSSDRSGCVDRAVRTWLDGGAVPARCAPVPPDVAIVTTPPRSVTDPTSAARAVRATIEDAAALVVVAYDERGGTGVVVDGLAAGKLAIGGLVVTLSRAGAAPGLSLSGRLALVPHGVSYAPRGTLSGCAAGRPLQVTAEPGRPPALVWGSGACPIP